MADFEIDGEVIVDDEATRNLEKIGRSADEASDSLEAIGKSADDTSRDMDGLSDSLSDAERSQLDNVAASQKLKSAQSDLRGKQEDLNKAVKTYGVDSKEATAKLRDFNTAQGNVNSMQSKLQTSTKAVSVNFKELTVGLSGVATAGMGLYNTYDRVADGQLAVDRANLKVKTSSKAVEDAHMRQAFAATDVEQAQAKLASTIEKYGVDSVEAATATTFLNEKLDYYKSMSDNATLATEKYDLATQTAQQTQDNFNESIMNAAVTIVPQAITMANSLSTTYKSFKDIDFSGLINKFTGKGGLAEGVTDVGGKTDILHGKLGGLNGISFSTILGGLAAVGVTAAYAASAASQVATAKSVYELEHAGEKMGTAETVATAVKGFATAPADIIVGQLGNILGIQTQLTNEQQVLVNMIQKGLVTAEEGKRAVDSGDYEIAIKLGQMRSGDISGGEYAQWLAARKRGSVSGAASGFEGVIAKPTLLMVGEKGAEAVNIAPIKGGSSSGGGGFGNVTVQVDSRPNITIENLNGSQNPEELVQILAKAIERGDGDRILTQVSRGLRRKGAAM